MRNYLNRLLEEKGIDQEMLLAVSGDNWTTNYIPLKVVVDYMSNASLEVQANIKSNLVTIDLNNGNVLDFFEYVAEFLAK